MALGWRVVAIAAAVAALAAPAVDSGAERAFRVGLLECEQVPGKGYNFIVRSASVLECVLNAPEGREHYRAEAGIGFGLDMQLHAPKAVAYDVFSPAGGPPIGNYTLSGRYFGPQASVMARGGPGATALVGGVDETITLRVLDRDGNAGFGVSAGLGYLVLEPASESL